MIENFVHSSDMLEEYLQSIAYNPDLVFNVDEVGIQIAESSICCMAGQECLNKTMNQILIHFGLCRIPGSQGTFCSSNLKDVLQASVEL
jgi:hypothetical protein